MYWHACALGTIGIQSKDGKEARTGRLVGRFPKNSETIGSMKIHDNPIGERCLEKINQDFRRSYRLRNNAGWVYNLLAGEFVGKLPWNRCSKLACCMYAARNAVHIMVLSFWDLLETVETCFSYPVYIRIYIVYICIIYDTQIYNILPRELIAKVLIQPYSDERYLLSWGLNRTERYLQDLQFDSWE